MRIYVVIFTIAAVVLGMMFIVDTEENKIAELEQTILAQERLMISLDSMIEGLLVRNDELSGANEALIRYSTPASCIRAIKHTKLIPLPKIKDSK